MEPSMWALETRAEHDRDDLRYSSDLTDAEWQIPAPSSAGRHRSWQMCELINAIFFVLRGGVPWRMLPEHFPSHQTTYRWFIRFRDDDIWKSLNHHLVMLDRELVGREASPSAAVIDHLERQDHRGRQFTRGMTPPRRSRVTNVTLWWIPIADA
jgi:transposase